MAFLCPAKFSRKKRRRRDDFSDAPGRLTGSSSIDTLVRVGLEKEKGIRPERNMIVLRDFSPLGPDEVRVQKGQYVNVLYKDNNWVYVITDHGAEGFIPVNYCQPRNVQRSSISGNQNHLFSSFAIGSPTSSGEGIGSPLSLNLQRTNSLPSVRNVPNSSVYQNEDIIEEWRRWHNSYLCLNSEQSEESFEKKSYGLHKVLYDYEIHYENDVTVKTGENVIVLNVDDPEWFWIQKKNDHMEGFVPASYLTSITKNRLSTDSDEYVKLKFEMDQEKYFNKYDKNNSHKSKLVSII